MHASWEEKRPDLERIAVPALVYANCSDHGLPIRGSLEGFERITSASKWFYPHSVCTCECCYSSERCELQRCFFEHFLQDEQNGWEATSRVRPEVSLPGHLSMRGILRYGQRGGALDHAHFIDRFEYETELTGYMTLSLRVSTSEGDNLDHFVLLRKFDAEGRRTSFFTDITALPVMGLPGADYVSPTTRLPLHMERGESARSCWRK